MVDPNYAAFFASLSDEELVRHSQPGSLVAEAEAAAHLELRSRGLPVLSDQADPPAHAGDGTWVDHGSRVLLQRNLSPQEAQLRAAFLRSMGVAADEGDVNSIQAQGLMAIALGGASIRVPESQRDQALQLLKALEAGEFSLPDDFESTP